tara:strand:- start:75981 stop:76775 length:795 start_codon:yes stop_codon:yes gene_type:complete
MGRIFLSRLILWSLLLLLGTNLGIAQNDYYVFKKSGKPFFNTDLPVLRGGVFSTSDVLVLHKQDTVLLINKNGELFELKKPNTYSFNTLKYFKKEENTDSFTKKYFSYVWKKFTNQQEIRQRPGVVYREERNIKLLTPIDSIRWNVPDIVFSWKNTTDSTKVYLHLEDLTTKHIFKIGINGNSLHLFIDNIILKNGNSYKWAVTTEPYPDFNDITFNNFELLNRESYMALENEMKALTIALKLLGFSEIDIKKSICKDYKFCQN